jgi:hypothetical protein
MPGSNLGNFTLSNTLGTPLGSTVFTVSTPMNFLPHPCPRLTMVNCTGSRFATDWQGAPADIPMFSYFRRAYSGQVIATNFHDADLNLAGNLISWTINVLRPYTGVGANYQCNIFIGGFAVSGGVTYPTYIAQSIDLKTPGLRTITAAGVSGSVGADSIAAIPFWISGRHQVLIGISPTFVPRRGDTLANMPAVMQAQTDQPRHLHDHQHGIRCRDTRRHDNDGCPAVLNGREPRVRAADGPDGHLPRRRALSIRLSSSPPSTP